MSRYIDAESLKGAVSSTMDMQTKYLPTQFVELIDNCPSEQAVVRGKWLKRDIDKSGIIYTEYYCSNCYSIKANFRLDFNFCPNCGAKMEESGETQ